MAVRFESCVEQAVIMGQAYIHAVDANNQQRYSTDGPDRAILASTGLKAQGHVTSGLALAQLKGGGGSGVSHHMLPDHFPFSVFPFLFHSTHPPGCLS